MEVNDNVELVVSTLEDENDGDLSSGNLSLREAISLANEQPGANTIRFSRELSGGTINLTQGDLKITDALSVEGLGAEKLTIDGNNSSRIFSVNDGNEVSQIKVEIKGLTVANGLAAEDGIGNHGGGIFNQENLTVTDSVISGNAATGDDVDGPLGGGVYTAGDLTLVRSTITGNSSIFGGGIFAKEATVSIQESTVSNNYSGFVGGGVYFDQSEFNISNSTISGNEASFAFGGLTVAKSSSGEINGSTINNNSALAGFAGGIDVGEDASVEISNSTIANNFAETEGGGIYAGDGTINISNSTVSGNEANNGGGGIYQRPDQIVGTPDGDLLIEGATVSLASSIVAGNIVDDISGEEISSSGNNLVGNGDGISGFIDSDLVGTEAALIDPLLGDLNNNGGVTSTLALLDGSPAIDAGSNPNGLEFDQRGDAFVRTVGMAPDIGAFELQTSFPVNPGPQLIPNNFVGTPDDDLITGTEENDTLEGLLGNDTLQGLDFADLLDGGLGNDSLDGGARDDQLLGGDGEDTLLGGNGKDSLDGGLGNDSLDGGASDDSLDGGEGNDTLLGNTGRDTLSGGLGKDFLDGGTSDDVLLGGDGIDTIDGGNGRDTLIGGAGDDFLTGGNSNDTFVLTPGEGVDIIADFNRGNNVIGLANGLTFEDLTFVGNDILLDTKTLAIITGVDTATLSESDFISF